MSKIMDMDFLNNKYVSNTVLSGIPENGEWTLNGFKLAYLIACEMSDYRIFIRKDSDIDSFNNDKIQEHLETVPKSYNISRMKFQEITGVSYANVAREISKSCDDLLTKITTLPNPFDPTNAKSFEKIQWFSKARYDDSKGKITIEIHNDMLPYFVVLVNYTKLDYKNIARLKNLYSARVYLICKIAQNRFNSDLQITITIEEFKNRIGLHKKYDNIPRLRSRVLDVVSDEINEKTDLNFGYQLHKTGRRFTDITLKVTQKANEKSKNTLNERVGYEDNYKEVAGKEDHLDKENRITILKLRSYGIKQDKASALVKIHGDEICNTGINKLLNEIDKGKDIKNVSGYLIKCIESQSNTPNSDDIQLAKSIADEIKQKKLDITLARHKEFDDYIKNNEQDILVLIMRYRKNQILFDANEINMFEYLKDVVEQYSDLVDNNLILTTKYNDEFLSYKNIRQVINELSVASNKDRIAKLKSSLSIKKQEYEISDGKEKNLVKKEIDMIQAEIADLV
ncbi:replication initiation protein [Facilibium subflavum]|uniref:replication initiation protein n=1 Tax=Facilibium subflavum TaxID=2219058 RepID=UPI0013C2CF81|nr:replication initiation protein [Facilibium subflavum]